MPVFWAPWGYAEPDESPSAPGVNQGAHRGVTKSAKRKPRRGRR